MDKPLYHRIYSVIRLIPPGRVSTYKQVALMEGNCTARQVGYALAALGKDPSVPWQRVINSTGTISARKQGDGAQRQRELLRQEGVVFNRNGRTDLERFGWVSPPIDWAR
ncbi:MAG: cysteine methyltransferase [Gammaproteobacteria bacterium]|nr:MAG: cysteine methyltransferase [Gammaproteobacteria bacterium]